MVFHNQYGQKKPDTILNLILTLIIYSHNKYTTNHCEQDSYITHQPISGFYLSIKTPIHIMASILLSFGDIDIV